MDYFSVGHPHIGTVFRAVQIEAGWGEASLSQIVERDEEAEGLVVVRNPLGVPVQITDGEVSVNITWGKNIQGEKGLRFALRFNKASASINYLTISAPESFLRRFIPWLLKEGVSVPERIGHLLPEQEEQVPLK